MFVSRERKEEREMLANYRHCEREMICAPASDRGYAGTSYTCVRVCG